jgi:hypothetical protein
MIFWYALPAVKYFSRFNFIYFLISCTVSHIGGVMVVKSHYNLILYYTSTYVERVGVSQHDNACSFIYSASSLKQQFTDKHLLL